MDTIKTIIRLSWYPALITALAVAGYIFGWPIEAVVPALIIILAIVVVVAIMRTREKQLEMASLRMRQLAEYFTRRFMGNSSLSIFAIINSLFNMDNPKIWEWARSCDMSKRVFDNWCDGFASRLEGDLRARKFGSNLGIYLNELWAITSHYHEFVEQFQEIASSLEIPREIADQYNRFVMEYNTFARDFQDNISELRKVTRTGIEPASIRFASELKIQRQGSAGGA